MIVTGISKIIDGDVVLSANGNDSYLRGILARFDDEANELIGRDEEPLEEILDDWSNVHKFVYVKDTEHLVTWILEWGEGEYSEED